MPQAQKAKITKSDFVRKMANTPAKEVVAAAAKAGMKLTERYVYVIRSADKAKGRRGVGGGRRAAGGGASEVALRNAIAELGLARARQVLADVEHAFGAKA